ncbi:MFS transporter [Ruegeria sp. 2012CJ41-6]|uniref:MFS transporter n=1 Tax=Ruegeria spongiae TaxID=2942209 RepID=A0ABT0Q2F5_9RHOB|nr:MFS transporter [Ruegeria spongiae]MCL6284016.1 MFS transporter [Ruegeria spongiae]
MFVLNGAYFGIWASRIPAMSDALRLSHETLGLALLFLAAGAVCSFPITGRLVDRFGAYGITLVVGVLYALSLILLGMAGGFAFLCFALFLFGACHGSMDVAMNAWGAEVDRDYKKAAMSSFHAMWSLGAGLGALSGFAAVQAQMSVLVHFLVAAVIVAVLTLAVARIGWASQRSDLSRGKVFAFPTGVLVLVGLTAFCGAMGEGAVADWSAIYLRDSIGAAESVSTLGYAVFSVAMVAVRFVGGWVIGALGPVLAARLGGAFATAGALAVVVGSTPSTALAGLGLMGVGYAVVMPLAFTRAANDPHVPQGQGIASVATLGYGGLLIGPPVIGFLAHLASLRLALAVLVPLAIVIVLLAGALRPRAQ